MQNEIISNKDKNVYFADMALSVFSDEHFMREALKLAEQAYEEDEVPIGAVVVCKNRIIAKGYNQVEKLNDATAHAEMLAITSACEHLGAKYLEECSLYVTLEPCVMCAGAIQWVQLEKIVFGTYDDKRGFSRYSKTILGRTSQIIGGILKDESEKLLKDFFKKKR